MCVCVCVCVCKDVMLRTLVNMPSSVISVSTRPKFGPTGNRKENYMKCMTQRSDE